MVTKIQLKVMIIYLVIKFITMLSRLSSKYFSWTSGMDWPFTQRLGTYVIKTLTLEQTTYHKAPTNH